MDCIRVRDQVVEMISRPDDPACNLSEVFTQAPNIKHHVDECQTCRDELADLIDMWAEVGLTAAGASPEGLSDRIVSRVLGGSPESSPGVELAKPPAPSWKQKWVSYSIAAGILALLVGGQLFYLNRVTEISIASREPSEAERAESLERAVAELERLQQQTQTATVQFVSFSPVDARVEGARAGVRSGASGHAVWDSGSGELHFFGFGLQQLRGSDRYAIWFQEGERNHLSATFSAARQGITSIRVAAPKDMQADRILITIDREDAATPSDAVLTSADL